MDTAENHCPVLIYSTNIRAYVFGMCRQNCIPSTECEQLLQLHPQEKPASQYKIMRSDEKCTNKKAEMTFET